MTIFQTEKRTILVSPHRTWWDSFIWPLRPSQSNLSLYEKELFTNHIFGWWIGMCGLFRSTVKIQEQSLSILSICWKRAIDYVPKWKPFLTSEGGVAIIANGEGPHHASDLYWSKRRKAGNGWTHWYESFGHPIDISDIKKMNDEGVAEVARRFKRSLIAWQWKHKNTPTKPFILIRLLKSFDSLSIVGIFDLLFSYPASFYGIQTNIEKQVKNWEFFSVFLFLRIIKSERVFIEKSKNISSLALTAIGLLLEGIFSRLSQVASTIPDLYCT